MKNMKTASALLALSLLMVGCNSASEKYTGISAIGSIESGMIDPIPYRDVVCGEAKELDACLANKDICQPLYKDNVDPLAEKIFVSCIANPEDSSEPVPPKDPVAVADPVKDPAAEPVKDPVVEPVKEPAKDVVKDPAKDPVKEPAKDVVKDPAKDPVKEPAKDVVKDPVKEPVKEPASEDAPELADIKDCSKLDAKYLSQKSNGQPKVIICHHDCHGESHAIEVACPALKAHLSHHEGKDYVGACKE